jgi:hypothetical protein
MPTPAIESFRALLALFAPLASSALVNNVDRVGVVLRAEGMRKALFLLGLSCLLTSIAGAQTKISSTIKCAKYRESTWSRQVTIPTISKA